MRVVGKGIDPAGRAVELTFEGHRLDGFEGESLAAALTAAGIKGLRRTRHDDRRGLFCGMGVCQECLVVVDGRGAQRACMTPVTAGLAAAPQPYL
ncbi:MAG: (2Fe-2S)-binding protein, partial [Geminicoccales bacterium]